MQGIKKILVTVDLSEYSLPTLRYAHDLANAFGAEITLINILNERDVRAIRGALDTYDTGVCEDFIKAQFEERQEMMKKLVENADARPTVEQHIVRVGNPHQALLIAIDQEKPDLVVMGTKGRSNLADVLVGS